MKRILTLALVSMTMFAYAGQGGPDAYGYIWKDSNEPGGPAYSWFNNVNNGEGFLVSGLGDDNTVGPFSLANPFQYYWYSIDKFYIGSNGYISVNNVNIASPFPGAIPLVGNGNNFIAGLMSDLNFSGTGNTGEVWVSLNADSTIITYKDVPFWNQATGFTGANTFQIILTDSDSSITVNYQSQSGLTQNNDIAIGIENLTGSIGLQHSLDTYPPAMYSVKYEYPSNVTFQVTDAGVNWNGNTGNKGIFVSKDGPQYTMSANYANAGNQPLGSFQVGGEVFTQAGTSIVSDNATIPNLSVGSDTTIVFGNTFSPTAAGTFYYEATVTPPSGDATPSNNSKRMEVVVIDTNASLINLAFADATAEGSLGWAGGNGGVGMYFAPPSYPAKLSYTSYYIVGNTNNFGFYAMVYDDDGLTGGPGTLLDSVFVPGAAISLGGYNVIPLNNTVSLTSGGVYVRWEMEGDGITIGTDSDQPISRRAFEILDNTWAAYRAFDNEDFMIALGYELDLPLDMGVTKIISPAANTNIVAATNVTVRIKNLGAGTLSSFPISYQLGSGTVVTENYNGVSLNPGDSADFTFFTQLLPPNGGNLCAFTALVNDVDNTNDATCHQVFGLGISEDKYADVTIYPVPATDFLHINYEGLIRAVNLQGQVVLERELQAGETLDVSTLQAGVYHIQFKGEYNWEGMKKFVVN